jgi:transcriptional regulator with XRE-family HTH domain
MSHKLQNYLRTYRKRSGLTQDEMAYLLGCESGTKLSRYERFSRKPGLETTLGCAIVFGAPCRDVFGGTWEKVEREIKRRAQLLTRRISRATPTPMATQKLEILQAITSGSATAPVNEG